MNWAQRRLLVKLDKTQSKVRTGEFVVECDPDASTWHDEYTVVQNTTEENNVFSVLKSYYADPSNIYIFLINVDPFETAPTLFDVDNGEVMLPSDEKIAENALFRVTGNLSNTGNCVGDIFSYARASDGQICCFINGAFEYVLYGKSLNELIYLQLML